VVNVYVEYLKDALSQLRTYRGFIYGEYMSAKTPEEAEFLHQQLKQVDEIIEDLEKLISEVVEYG